MIGYHATASRNVSSILERGLVPYKINKSWADPSWRGIWLWEDRPSGIDWLHIALQRWIDHQSPQVSLLAVEYEHEWTQDPSGAYLTIHHDGTMQGSLGHEVWYYHRGVRAHIAWQPIPAENITFLDECDFTRATTDSIIDLREKGYVDMPVLPAISGRTRSNH